MEAVARSTIQASLDASAYTGGARQIDAANRQMSQSAQAVVAAGERVEVTTNRAGRAFERVQQTLDRNYAAMQRFERAQESINRAQERGLVSQERAGQLIQLAQQRYLGTSAAANAASTSLGQFGAANDNAAQKTGRMSQVMGQAGFQIQDFAVQVASGQSAMVAFVQQGSQLAGAFGPTGIWVGVALAITGVVFALTGVGDAQKKVNETLERSDALYRGVTEAARQYRTGLQDEAEALATLEARYRDLNEARRQYELRQATARRDELTQLQTRLGRDVNPTLNRLAMEAERQVAAEREAALRARQIGAPAPIPATDARDALAAVYEFRSGPPTAERILQLSERLREAGAAAGGFREQIADAVAGLDPFVTRAEELDRRLRQVEQIMALASGQALPGLATGMDGAASAAERMTGQVVNLVREMQRLAQLALDNPTMGLDARLSRAQERIDALRQGGLRRYEAVTGFQTQAERAQQLAAEERDRVRQALANSRQFTPEQIEARLRESDPARALRAQQIAEADSTEERLRKEAEEREREANRAGARGARREERIAERLADATRDAEAQARAQTRIADAYGQSEEAGRRAEATERALAAVRKTGSDITDEESAAVQRLAQAFEAEARARSDVQSRIATRNIAQETELLEAQARTITMTAEARERELAAVRARQQIEARGGDPASNASRAYISAAENAAAARLEQERLIQGAKTFQDIGNRAADAFGKTLVDALMEGRDAFDALNETAKRVLNEILNEMLRMAVINPLKNMAFGGNAPSFFNGGAGSMGGAGGFLSLFGGAAGGAKDATLAAAQFVSFAGATGAAFDRGNVIPFASGGIVERPTLFPMAAGTGLMGEAGPEAILPLRRGPDGKLGVSAQGSGAQMDARARRVSPRVTINVTTPDASSFRSSEGQIAATASRVLQRAGRNL